MENIPKEGSDVAVATSNYKASHQKKRLLTTVCKTLEARFDLYMTCQRWRLGTC